MLLCNCRNTNRIDWPFLLKFWSLPRPFKALKNNFILHFLENGKCFGSTVTNINIYLKKYLKLRYTLKQPFLKMRIEVSPLKNFFSAFLYFKNLSPNTFFSENGRYFGSIAVNINIQLKRIFKIHVIYSNTFALKRGYIFLPERIPLFSSRPSIFIDISSTKRRIFDL